MRSETEIREKIVELEKYLDSGSPWSPYMARVTHFAEALHWVLEEQEEL